MSRKMSRDNTKDTKDTKHLEGNEEVRNFDEENRPLGSGRTRKHKKYKRKTLKYKNRGFKKNKKTKNRRR
tara:strand:- start:5 stop:214 length:210 start_codon:yes stop_codon:yes gene_type:complete